MPREAGVLAERPLRLSGEGSKEFKRLVPAAGQEQCVGQTEPDSHGGGGGGAGFNVKYEVRISGSESLANPVFVASNLTDRFVDVSAVDLEAGQTYYWGVTASNSAGTRVAGPFTFGTVGSCRADFNGEGGVTVQDLFDFLASWFAGCP